MARIGMRLGGAGLALVASMLALSCDNYLGSVVQRDIKDFQATPPVVDTFTLSSSTTYDDVVGFTIVSAHPGTSAGSITHWLVSESATAPAADDGSWSVVPPPVGGTYTVSDSYTLANPGTYGDRTLYAWLKNDRSLVSAPAQDATKTVMYAQYGAPVVNFNLTSVTPTDNPAITFDLSSSTAGDGASSITGWLINESSTAPGPGDIPAGSAPTGWTVSLAVGTHTVYAWAKNDQNKVGGASVGVTINHRSATLPILPVITGHEQLAITFDVAMESATVTGTGTPPMNPDSVSAVWSNGNKTLTVSSLSVWPQTGGGLTVNGTTFYGIPIDPANQNYSVFHGVCVSAATGNDTPNTGTYLAPFATIQKGIDIATAKYSTSEVRVAGGTYTNNAVPGYVVDLKNGIRLLGGYLCNGTSTDWTTRNPLSNVTTIEDTSVGTGTVEYTPNAAVHCDSGITDSASTVIDGFTIISGKGGGTDNANAGIFCEGAATIQNNSIRGRSSSADAGKFAIGITVKSSSPVITWNTIDAGWNKVTAGSGNAISYGIYVYQSSPVIDANTIAGGKGGGTAGAYTCGIQIVGVPNPPASPTPTVIRNNVVQGGSSTTTSYGIRTYNQATKIYNNTIDGGSGANARCVQIQNGGPELKNNIFFFVTTPSTSGYCVYEAVAGGGADPSALDNNNFGPAFTALYLDNSTTPVTLIDAGTITTGEAGSPNTLAYWNNVGVDPKITGAPSDFRLTSESPVEVRTGGIDGAAAGWGFTVDRAGASRSGSNGTGWSMGAYEY